MEIFVNGERRETAADSLTGFVAELGLPPEALLIEHNGVALHRSEWLTTMLRPDDRLEILRVSAGG
jgi:thiamine biosynthesis protein ThiS